MQEKKLMGKLLHQ